jgi:hypothetical protein
MGGTVVTAMTAAATTTTKDPTARHHYHSSTATILQMPDIVSLFLAILYEDEDTGPKDQFSLLEPLLPEQSYYPRFGGTGEFG